MTTAATAWQDLLQRLASSMNDSELANFLAVHHVISDDDLADAIDIDGRARDAENATVDLHRYMTAIPLLQDRPVVLDTALEATLRSMRRAGIDQVQAVAILVEDYPRLAAPIRTCAMLDECVAGTSTIAAGATVGQPLVLPCGLGEEIEDGKPRYELREQIGRGNQAMVYLAVDRRLSTQDSPAWVAIKVMTHLASEDDLAMPSLGSEAHAARRVNHPNVVRVLDRGLTGDNREFVVYEYVRGMTLHEARNRRAGPVEPREAARLVVQIARGLQAAHNAAVLHCDLKPANVLLTDGGAPKIADFGLARHVQTEDLAEGPVGSFAFMSPEQFAADADANMTTTDIYSLGGVLYWLLTDAAPNGMDADSVATRLRAGADAPPASPKAIRRELDDDLAAICARAIHPRRTERYASAEALACDLEDYLACRPISWRSPTLVKRAKLAYRRSPRSVATMTAVIGAGMIAVAGSALYWHAASVRAVARELEIERQQRLVQERSQKVATEAARAEGVASTVKAWGASFKATKDGPFTNWLQGTVVLEGLLGGAMYTHVDLGGMLWPERVDYAAKAIEQARAAGKGDDFETRVWETLEGLWLIKAGKYAAARDVLATSESRWRALLGDNDGMVRAAADLKAVAEYALARDTSDADSQDVAARRELLEQRLGAPETQDQVKSVISKVLAPPEEIVEKPAKT